MGVYSNYNDPNVIQESTIGLKIDEIFSKNKTKSAIMAKIKEMDKKYGEEGSKEYEKKDTLNALIVACFGVLPSLGATGTTILGGGLGPFPLGITVGIVGLYLSGLLHEKNKCKYDKESLLKSTMKKVEARIPKLEAGLKLERNEDRKKEYEKRIKDANAVVKYCDKELHKIKRERDLYNNKKDSSNDDFLDDFDIDLDMDFDNWSLDESTIINESISKSEGKPVFIVTVEGNSFVSGPIKKFTKSVYTHSGLALTSSLDKIYSFGGKMNSVNGKLFGGINLDSVSSYLDDNRDGVLQVNAVFLKNEDYDKLKSKLDYMVKNADKTSYDIIGLVDIIINRSKSYTNRTKMICSAFVYNMFKLINVDITGTNSHSNLVTPKHLSEIDNPKVYKVYEGKILDYDENIVKSRLGHLYSNANFIKECVIFETKELGVRFNEEGDLILKNPKQIDFVMEHRKSKKLFPTYKKNGNLDGMEYELCKLWYMNIILLKKIETEKNKEKKEKLYDIRSKILNEFNLYLNEVTKLDPTFNFDKYYQATPFGNETIKISGSTIKYSTEYLKRLIL